MLSAHYGPCMFNNSSCFKWWSVCGSPVMPHHITATWILWFESEPMPISRRNWFKLCIYSFCFLLICGLVCAWCVVLKCKVLNEAWCRPTWSCHFNYKNYKARQLYLYSAFHTQWQLNVLYIKQTFNSKKWKIKNIKTCNLRNKNKTQTLKHTIKL